MSTHCSYSVVRSARIQTKIVGTCQFRMDCFQFLPEPTLSGLCRKCCGCGYIMIMCLVSVSTQTTASLVLIPVRALVSWCQKCRPGLSHTFKLKVEYVYNRPLSQASQQQVPYPAQWRIIETYLPHFILVHLSALSS